MGTPYLREEKGEPGKAINWASGPSGYVRHQDLPIAVLRPSRLKRYQSTSGTTAIPEFLSLATRARILKHHPHVSTERRKMDSQNFGPVTDDLIRPRWTSMGAAAVAKALHALPRARYDRHGLSDCSTAVGIVKLSLDTKHSHLKQKKEMTVETGTN